MTKISELPVLADAGAADTLPIVDVSGSITNKVTRSGLVTGGFPIITTTGTAAALILTLPASLTNAAGHSFNVRFHLAPSAGATIAIDGQTALSLRLYNGAGTLTTLAAGDVAIDSVVTLTLVDDGGTLRAVVGRDRSLSVSAPDCVFSGPSQSGAGTYALDATIRNKNAIATLSGSGVVTINQAGTYLISGTCSIRLTSAITTASASVALRDVTAGTYLVSSGMRDSGFGSQAAARVMRQVTIGAANDYAMHFARDSSSYTLDGGQASAHSTADNEIGYLEIWRLS